MTIATDPALAAALLAAGTENNPVIAHVNEGASATVSTTTGTEGAAAVNAVSGATYNFWSCTPSGGNLARIQFVFASAVTLNFVGIAAHNLGDLGATVKVQHSLNSGGSWIDSAAGSVSPADNAAIGFRFQDVTATHWRLTISGVSADVVIGLVLLSREIVIPDRIYQGYAPPLTPTQVDLQSNVSEGGHLLGSSVVRMGSAATASFGYVAPAFLRGASWLAFQAAFNSGEGFFWAWRPEKYGDLFYAWRAGAVLRPTNSGPRDLMSFDLAMRFYHEP